MEKKTDKEKIQAEINIFDHLIVLAKRKKFIITITLSIAIITAIYSLFIPPIYMAETKILRTGSDITNRLSGQLGGAGGMARRRLAFIGKKDLYINIIKSRTIYDRIIDRFGLMNLYGTEGIETARKILDGAVRVESKDMSIIMTITVQNKDPKLAADIANAFVDELKNSLQNLAITEASQRRLFFEKQMKQTGDALIKSEEAMREFQEKTGVLKVERQAGAVIESITNLRAQLAAKEVELKVMRTYSTPNNPDLQMVEETLKGLKIELAKLESKDGRNPDPLIPTGRIPAVSTDYSRKLRDLKFNEKLFELMAKQYEAAKIAEARDAILIQVIEKAIPPVKRLKPMRRKMVELATVVGFFFSVFLAFFMEYFERASMNKENRDRIETLKRYLFFKRKK